MKINALAVSTAAAAASAALPGVHGMELMTSLGLKGSAASEQEHHVFRGLSVRRLQFGIGCEAGNPDTYEDDDFEVSVQCNGNWVGFLGLLFCDGSDGFCIGVNAGSDDGVLDFNVAPEADFCFGVFFNKVDKYEWKCENDGGMLEVEIKYKN